MKKNTAIILKTFLHKSSKITLFDKELGKIQAVYSGADIYAGALLEYVAIDKGHIFFLKEVELINAPLAVAREDILFVHHILELVFVVAPDHQRLPDVYELLQWIYETQWSYHSIIIKKLFVLKLFVLLGIYSENFVRRAPQLYQLLAEPIDIIATQALDLEIKQLLDHWLYECAASHPYINQLKTIAFLQKE